MMGGGWRKARVEEIEGKGRGVVGSDDIRGGDIILTDSPILMYPARAGAASASASYCFHCFRTRVVVVPFVCPVCSKDIFCSPKCVSQALSSSHTPWVCHSLSQLSQLQNSEDFDFVVQSYFLIAAYNLASVNPSHFQILMSLHSHGGVDQDNDNNEAQRLHSLIQSLSPSATVSFQLTSALLSKDKLNSFGIMEPMSPTSLSPLVRAYAIYPNASFFNHDCLPNACRFDYIHNNTDITIRALHHIPKGREICLSYFPVNLNYTSRQTRLLLDYNFTCRCDRCQVESNWSDNEQQHDAMSMEEEEEEEEEEMENEDNSTDFPHAYFFITYMCSRDNCWGTLAPLPPSPDATPSPFMECNVCANISLPTL